MDGRGGGEPALTEPPAEERGRCLWCGGEVYAGEPAFAGNGGLVHGECIVEFLAETPGVAFLAAVCGFEEVIP